jgi:pheromone shutdown protein TraB
MSEGDSEDVLPAEETAVTPQSASGEGSVTIVGTAHVSRDSVEEVERTIEEQRPDVVAVELDETRYKRMNGETPDDIEAGDLISGKTVYQFLAYWMLSYVQARLGDRFDIEPGADMMAAIEKAESVGSGVALVDRDIQETVRRLWTRMRRREKLSIVAALLVEMGGPWTVGLSIGLFLGLFVAFVGGLVAGPFLVPAGVGADIGIPVVGSLVGTLAGFADTLLVGGLIALVVGVPIGALLVRAAGDVEEQEEIDLDRLTDADVVTAMMEEFRRFSPGGAEALIDERDAYIASRLIALRDAGYDVVAVVGAGHREGIERYLDAPETLPPAESLVGDVESSRVASILYKTIGYALTVGFFAFFVLLAMAGVENFWLLRLFVAWFLVNGVIAAGLALLAGAHWTSAGVGGAVAWLTSVNPLLAPGWFAGYVELRYTTVNVADISKLNDMLADEETPILQLLKRMRDEVPTFRLILVVALTNVGSFVASVLFATVFLPYFAADVGGIGGLGELMLDGAARSARLIWETVT